MGRSRSGFNRWLHRFGGFDQLDGLLLVAHRCVAGLIDSIDDNSTVNARLARSSGTSMFALPGYDAFLGFLLIAAAVPALALVTNKLVAPKSRAGERQLTYESGMEPIGGAWIQFNIRYYMFALFSSSSMSRPCFTLAVAFVVSACWPSLRLWFSSPSCWWPWPTPGAKAPLSGASHV